MDHPSHSTEMTVSRGYHDITTTLDSNYYVALVMLDLFAAFDVIDHWILLMRLEFSFGITGAAIAWVRSCLLVARILSSFHLHIQRTFCFFVEYLKAPFVDLNSMRCLPNQQLRYTVCRRHDMIYYWYANDTRA